MLLHESFSIQDQAVQGFEHWQNKKAIPALKHLEKFDKEWWTNYIEEVIEYIQFATEEGDE